MKSVIKAERLSIVPVGGDSREVRATDTLPVICWNKPHCRAGRKTRIARTRDLTKVVIPVREYVQKLQAKVTELNQLVEINF